MLARLKTLVEQHQGDGKPIHAWGYDPGMQAGHLDRDMLDAVSTSVPIWIMSYAPHIVYTNSLMIEKIGVHEQTRLHGLGRFADGRLNGWFVEAEACAVAARAVREDVYGKGFGLQALEIQGRVAVSGGVTTSADMIYGIDSFDREWDDHSRAIELGTLPMRMLMVPYAASVRKRYGDDFLRFYEEMEEKSTDRLAVHGVKFVNDGSYPSMTLKLNFPGYLDGEEGLTGDVPWEDMVERMLPFWKAGIQIHSHANGDETVDMTLNTLTALLNEAPRFDHRFTIEHYCISTPAQARRLAALGGVASVNPYFVHYRSDIHDTHGFGPDRTESTARLGSLASAGATFALHSDYNLVVVPMHPLTAAWVAVNRFGADGETVLAPGERITVERALRAITVDAAYVLNRTTRSAASRLGSMPTSRSWQIAPSRPDPKKLREIEILGTILAGEFHPAETPA